MASFPFVKGKWKRIGEGKANFRFDFLSVFLRFYFCPDSLTSYGMPIDIGKI